MKYILGVIGLFLVTIVAIILITRGRSTAPQQEGKPQVRVSQHAKPGTSVALTTQGKLVGESERRSIRVKVTQTERRLEILTGYEEAVEQAHVYPNTEEAYETFLIALDRAGFARERQQEVRVSDERGVCPLGRSYIYEFKEFSQQVVRLWNTSCGTKSGTFGGSSSTIRKLFEAQIPEYRKRIRGTKLTSS